MALTLLQSNQEYGVATFATEQLDALIKTYGVYAVHCDEDQEVYLMCEHPVSKVFGWYTIPDLFATEEGETTVHKLSVVRPN